MATTTTSKRTISIYRDGVWAGSGTLTSGGRIEDCAAELGPDADASEQTYDAIEAAIRASDESVDRPDGEYTWTIEG